VSFSVASLPQEDLKPAWESLGNEKQGNRNTVSNVSCHVCKANGFFVMKTENGKHQEKNTKLKQNKSFTKPLPTLRPKHYQHLALPEVAVQFLFVRDTGAGLQSGHHRALAQHS